MDQTLTPDQIKERVEETLVGLAVTLVRLIDASQRVLRPGLSIVRDNISSVGCWLVDPPVSFDFKNFVVLQAMRFGELKYDMAAKVADQIIEAVLNGDPIIPGFDVHGHDRHGVLLRQSPPQ